MQKFFTYLIIATSCVFLLKSYASATDRNFYISGNIDTVFSSIGGEEYKCVTITPGFGYSKIFYSDETRNLHFFISSCFGQMVVVDRSNFNNLVFTSIALPLGVEDELKINPWISISAFFNIAVIFQSIEPNDPDEVLTPEQELIIEKFDSYGNSDLQIGGGYIFKIFFDDRKHNSYLFLETKFMKGLGKKGDIFETHINGGYSYFFW